jgi:mRNA interferase RelE/StbE
MNSPKNLVWDVKFRGKSAKLFEALPHDVQERIWTFLHERVIHHPNPRALAEALQGDRYAGQYRFRVGDYRIVCRFEDNVMIIIVLNVGHRSRIYLR